MQAWDSLEVLQYVSLISLVHFLHITCQIWGHEGTYYGGDGYISDFSINSNFTKEFQELAVINSFVKLTTVLTGNRTTIGGAFKPEL